MLKEEKQQARIKELSKKLEYGISRLNDSDEYKKYLKAMARFHDYSANNVMLILMQYPTATLVAGYRTWQKLGRQVKRGERGIWIIAPNGFFTVKAERKKLQEDGSVGVDEEEIKVPRYKAVNVFDISQTDGKEIPSFTINELSGDVENFNKIFKSIADITDCKVEVKPVPNAKGYYYPAKNEIAIKEGMSQIQTIKTLIHETAHSILHKAPVGFDRNIAEVQAESVAFVVSSYYNIDTSDYSFKYVLSWAKDNTELLNKSLDVIQKTANDIITKLNSALEIETLDRLAQKGDNKAKETKKNEKERA